MNACVHPHAAQGMSLSVKEKILRTALIKANVADIKVADIKAVLYTSPALISEQFLVTSKTHHVSQGQVVTVGVAVVVDGINCGM